MSELSSKILYATYNTNIHYNIHYISFIYFLINNIHIIYLYLESSGDSGKLEDIVNGGVSEFGCK